MIIPTLLTSPGWRRDKIILKKKKKVRKFKKYIYVEENSDGTFSTYKNSNIKVEGQLVDNL